MKKDNDIKRILRYRNRELRTRLFQLSPFWFSILIFVIALLILAISLFIYDYNNWASGVLVSTSCGCFTGLVFYFLSNIRNNKIAKLQKEFRQLKEVLEILKNITNLADCYKFKGLFGEKRNIFDDSELIFLWLNDLENARNQLPLELYDILPEKGYDPADRDNLNSYRDHICSAESKKFAEAILLEINKELLPLLDYLQEMYREREDQLMLMGKHFF